MRKQVGPGGMAPDGGALAVHAVTDLLGTAGPLDGARHNIMNGSGVPADDANRRCEVVRASEPGGLLLSDLERTIDLMNMGVVLVDAALNVEIVNKAFHQTWNVPQDMFPVGTPFRALIDANRHNGANPAAEDKWEGYVASRLAEIKAGDVAPREFRRVDGRTVVYSVTALSGGKRLVTYHDVTATKAHEAELAEALELATLAEAVIDGIKDPIFVKDEALRFVFVNEAFASLFGLRPEAMLGLRTEDLIPAEHAHAFEEVERTVLETGEPYEGEENFEVPGIGSWSIVRKNRVTLASGKHYLAGFIFDLAEHKRREMEAEEARQRLADVLEMLPAGVVIYDRDDRFIFANGKLKDTMPALGPALVEGGSLRESLVLAHQAGYYRITGNPELDGLYDVDPAGWLEGSIAAYHQNHVVSERRNPDGSWFQVYDQRLADGTFIGVRIDITELKERERALQESMRENELFRSLIDNVPVSIYAKRDDLKLMYVNQGWCELTGYSKQEAIGRTDAEIFGADGEAFMEADREVMQSGETIEVEETATEADGSIRHQFARKGAMVASDGSLYLIGSTTDISELKQREKELEEAQRRAVLADRAKSEFLANMSHEIRTPMNGVLGMAELLAKSDLDPKQKTFTDIIVKSGNALLTIINDILDFSKIDAGQLVLDPVPFNLAEAIEDVATLVSTRAKENDIELIVRVQPGLHELFVGDVGRIRQIITNLLGNAVKFTEAGHVLVDVRGEGDGDVTRLHVAVTDTGIGIPADKLGIVFEKFSQVDASSTRRHEGTGLGLAITSRLVHLMGGEIGVESVEGKGSTFWFSLVLPNADVVSNRPATPVDVTGARVLVIDDNAVNRAILSEQMAAWGFDSCAAETGAEGLTVLLATARMGVQVDCIVLDYQMPGMTGADVARVVRSTPALADTPIVMLTSVDQSLSNSSYRDLAIDAHLIKPARSSALLETLVATIQRRRYPGGVRFAPEAAGEVFDDDRQGRTGIAASQPAASIRARKRPRPSDNHRLDILVAEDNEVNQLVFTQILADTDYTFEIVGNGRRALAAYGEMMPRMILMDVSMPEMNGIEATAAIRQIERDSGSRVPIIGVTAHALKGDKERCLEAGMDDYLPKPISPRALLEKIERWSWQSDGDQRDAM